MIEKDVYKDVKVTKLECVGHVQKCMGSRMRSSKKRSGNTHLYDGKPIGGRRRLTDNVIDSMQVYYDKAIRNNTHSVQAMQDAIWAVWYHMQSTDEKADHSRCPVGEDSWCGFQRNVAKKTSTYTRKNPLPKAVATAIYPVFEALTAEEWLSGCLHGGAQSQNEAFNGLIWQRATEETHSSLCNWQSIWQWVSSMMDRKQCYLSWKTLVLTLEFIHPKRPRKSTNTGFSTRGERARTHTKSATERLDRQKKDIMKLRKVKK